MAWEKSHALPWHERAPYYSLIACVAVYVRVFVASEQTGDDTLGMLIGIPYSGIEGLDLEIVAAGDGGRIIGERLATLPTSL
jgi:hypothetical protein